MQKLSSLFLPLGHSTAAAPNGDILTRWLTIVDFEGLPANHPLLAAMKSAKG